MPREVVVHRSSMWKSISCDTCGEHWGLEPPYKETINEITMEHETDKGHTEFTIREKSDVFLEVIE